MHRAIVLCLGVFTLLSLPGAENLWWIDIRPLPPELLVLPGVVFCVYGCWPARWRRAAVHCAAALLAVALWNCVAFYRADVDAAVRVPFSLVVAALLGVVIVAPRTRWPRLAAAATALALVAGFPIAHVFFFGKTSYAREADVIVVFGARCYADGKPSQSLADRVRTGCRLYHEGRAPRLLMSGGPGDGAVHETDAMRKLAIELGVPEAAIAVDRDGLDTWSTVRNTGRGRGRVLAVSHFYHLPRIKLAYRRAGREAYTVPAEEAYTVSQTPHLIAREVAAFWWYWATSWPWMPTAR